MSEADSQVSKSELMDRDTLGKWATQQIKKGTIDAYRAKNNSRSLDGLPGMNVARRTKGETLWLGDMVAWLQRVSQQKEALMIGALLGLLFLRIVSHVLPANMPIAIGHLRLQLSWQ